MTDPFERLKEALWQLDPKKVELLANSGRIFVIKVVSDVFEDMSIMQRIELTLDTVEENDPAFLKAFDVTFEVLSEDEDAAYKKARGNA